MNDTMNDPDIDARRRNSEKGSNEGDTCRICRGDGSQDEPLFYPCKCSGSIKFVHQACLMEWLSHSQKKHCELCKTPFRFTKLYDPHMPNSVPLSVFFKQASLHVLHGLMTWSRWNLVIFVWLGWVPWCMRTIWRGLFWLGDGAWVTRNEIERYARRLERLSAIAEAASHNGTSLLTNVTSSTASVITGILPKWNPISQTLNYTSREPAILWLSKRLISGFIFPYNSMMPTQNATGNFTVIHSSPRSPSVLSDVKFLKNITRWGTLNNILIDVLEGQMITLGIVITFILVFLIREWVVQQQPIVNLGAAAEGAMAPERPARGNNELPNAAPLQNEAGNDGDARPDAIPEEQLEQDTTASPSQPNQLGDYLIPLNESVESEEDANRTLKKKLTADPSPARSSDSITGASEPNLENALQSSGAELDDTRSSSSLSRPAMPAKASVAQATDIQRTLEEESGATGKPWPGVDVFMDLWNRADGDPDRVLHIIEREGQGEQLGWIVSAMQRLQQRSIVKEALEEASSDQDKKAQVESTKSNPDGKESKRSSDSWQVVESQDERHELIDTEHSTAQTENSNLKQSRTSSQASSSQASLDSLRGEPSRTPLGSDTEELPLREDNVSGQNDGVEVAAADLPPHDALNGEEPEQNEPRTIRAVVRDWVWGGLPPAEAPADEPEGDDERVVEDIANEAPFVPVADGQRVLDNAGGEMPEDDNPFVDPEVVRAAAEAGIDPNDVEAIEEGEDLEGIMELIGVQGPLAGLVQNGMFSTVLISMTVLFGIWIPYLCGKAILVLIANPIDLLLKMPLRWTSTTADMILDSFIFVAGCAFYWLDRLVRLTAIPVSWVLPFVQVPLQNQTIPLAAYRYTWNAAERLARNFIATGGHFSGLDIPIFSIVAHESLKKAERFTVEVVSTVFSSIRTLAESPSPGFYLLGQLWHWCKLIIQGMLHLPRHVAESSAAVANSVSTKITSNPLKIDLDIPARTEPLDYDLSNWNTQDRIFAIIVGYIFFSVLGALYMKLRRFIKDFQEGELQDGVVVDVLNQAAGVLKVIFIITIEMIVFPLYCGVLLDIALLPLFENTTVVSRLLFTATSPATSLFVHWFVGTCYMFHFALFVSMCRKIMRSGVLYFIRDPDDPSFHPVRDVLERNVSTQLRKILFSALVYGGLVIVCLGAVVWGLSTILTGVFPIHWSSNEPVLEFPVDLLVYNFLMPVAIKFFKPATGLHGMYRWWFQRCARALRLTHFLFNERKEDEEGHFKWMAKSEKNVLDDQTAETSQSKRQKSFVSDGQLVRAPASDQVRIPKGRKTFVEIDEEGNRLDGLPDNHNDLHGRDNKMFASIYIPPHFRLRIAGFIILLWLFAATTGVSLTIVPLVFGRYVFSHLIPSQPPMNDIYTFAIGIYLLGGPLYFALLYRVQINSSLQRLAALRNVQASTITSFLSDVSRGLLRFLRLVYFYGAFTLLLPSLFALVYEAYLLIPLHTYFTRNEIPPSTHTVHFISDWTLGILYVRVGIRLILRFQETRPSRALRALVNQQSNGVSWLNPDIGLATRAFIIPLTLLLGLALLLPLGLGWVLNSTWFYDTAESSKALVYRYSYPAVLFIILTYAFGRVLARAIGKWRAKVRDEVYLIGERLHNLGEKKPKVKRVMTA